MNHTRIAVLLAQGIKPGQVASIVGVSPARISQLLNEESFKLVLAEKQAEFEKADVEEEALSTKYSAVEHQLLNQIIELAPTSELRDVTSALRVVAERQEKMKLRTTQAAPAQQTPGVGVMVSINLPSHALQMPTVHLNEQRQVVAIDDRVLAPMSSDAVTNLFTQMKGDSHERLPSHSSTEASPQEALPAASSPDSEGFLSYAVTG